MSDRKLIDKLLNTPDALSADELRALADDCPCFALPAILLLRDHAGELTDTEADTLRTRLAISAGDRDALYRLAAPGADRRNSFYPPDTSAEGTSPTYSAIDTFFANYGSADDAESQLLERMIFNPAPDYAEVLARESGETLSDDLSDFADLTGRGKKPAPSDESDNSDSLASSEPSEESARPDKPASPRPTPPPAGSLLSESLAGIFIKQGRYERAYEIIYNLNLKYPKKSIYFADQLRFLQKLIKIQKLAAAKPDATQNDK